MRQKNPERVEARLKRAILKYGGRPSDAARVKKWIYGPKRRKPARIQVNETFKKFFGLFPKNLDSNALGELTEVLQDAWNAFPHQCLDDKSPQQMIAETQTDNDPVPEDHEPTIICGNKEMSWDEYEEMLKEMECCQKPFKQRIERTILPKYGRFLRRKKSEKDANMHFEVADIFFERVLHVGFLDLESVRPDFVQKEFPRWWVTHILMDNKKPKDVLASLKLLFGFLEEKFDIEATRFGFKA